MPSIQARLDRAKRSDYLSWDDCALLLNVSKKTIQRREAKIAAISSFAILREGRTVRIQKTALFRVFKYQE